jgi:orotidine-5'-phosphate decarboxylase
VKTPEHFADRLVHSIDRVGAPVCVGLDPVLEKIPDAVKTSDPVASIESFCAHVLDAVTDVVPAVKVQSACFERYGGNGVSAMQRVIEQAHNRGFVVILDAKRGDIGISAQHYAAFAFDACGADALTISIAMGPDTAVPYLRQEWGVFALVRTSNPGSDRVQSAPLHDGQDVATLFGQLVRELGSNLIGTEGFSSVGAVVAATKPDDAARMRAIMPEQIFLVPGYGVQGGTAESVKNLFDSSGRGVLVTASRSVLYAQPHAEESWSDAVRAAAQRLADDLASL